MLIFRDTINASNLYFPCVYRKGRRKLGRWSDKILKGSELSKVNINRYGWLLYWRKGPLTWWEKISKKLLLFLETRNRLDLAGAIVDYTQLNQRIQILNFKRKHLGNKQIRYRNRINTKKDNGRQKPILRFCFLLIWFVFLEAPKRKAELS